MPGRTHFVLLLMAGVAACGGDTSTTGDVPVRIEDSAGVRIVAYQDRLTPSSTHCFDRLSGPSGSRADRRVPTANP